MMPALGEDSYLVGQLLDFHAALVRLKASLAAPAEVPALTGPGSAAPSDTAGLALALRSLLDRQAAEALELGGRHGREQAEAAHYLKVALADEALIGLADWPQRKEWIACPLELRLYGTRSAGERIFDRISWLLAQPAPSQRDLALLYLMALAMGFQGRYRNQADGAAVLQNFRRDLYRHACNSWPDPVFAHGRSDSPELGPRLLPQAYRHTRSAANVRLLPNPARWAAYFALTALGLLLLSQLAWHGHTDSLVQQLAAAEASSKGRKP